MAQSYEVNIKVHGTYSCHVTAESEEEAIAIAESEDFCGNADFGELHDIEWGDGKVVSEF